MITTVLVLLAAYFIGGIPFGYLLVRLKTGQDVRSMGSGNIGATNVLRSSGRSLGVLTLALDVLKGWFAVLLAAHFLASDPAWMAAAGVAVVLGHAFPAVLRFKGGKAVASFVGVALALAPGALLGVLVIFILIVAWTRYISLGSILGAAVFPFGAWLIYHPGWPVLAACFFCSALIIWRHSSNIARLRAGTENVFRFGGQK